MANKFQKQAPVDQKTLETALKDEFSFFGFQQAFQKLGIKLDEPGQKTPESDGVPRIFMIKDGETCTLEEENAQVGTPAFMEALLSGQIFAFPNGKNLPVQMQGRLMGDKLLTENSRPLDYEDPRDRISFEPAEPPAPRWYHRLFGFIPANRQRINAHARWQTEHAEWERESAKAETEYQQRKDEIETVVAAFPYCKTRDEDAFKDDAKMQEQVDRDIARENAKTTEKNDLTYRDSSIDLATSLYGTHPQLHEEWVKKERDKDEGFYTRERFAELTTADVDPAGVQIGGQGLTEQEFAALAMFAATNEETSIRIQNKAVGDSTEALADLQKAGYTQAQAKRIVADSVNSTFTIDLLNQDGRLWKYFPAVNEGRALAADALKTYQNGDKTKLAEILGRAVEHGGMHVGRSESKAVNAIAKLGREMLGLMERDLDLKRLAKESFEKRERAYTEGTRIPTLNFDKLVDNIRKMEKFEDLQRKGARRHVELFNARAEGKELTTEQKKECLRDILVANMAEALQNAQIQKSGNEAASAQNQPFNKNSLNEEYFRLMKLAPPQAAKGLGRTAGGSSLPATAGHLLMGGLARRTTKMADTVDIVANEAELQKLTRTVNQIIEKDHLAEMSVEELLNNVVKPPTEKKNMYTLDRLLKKALEAEKIVPGPQKEGPKHEEPQKEGPQKGQEPQPEPEKKIGAP